MARAQASGCDELRIRDEEGQVSDERVNHRSGYRPRGQDTRAGSIAYAFVRGDALTRKVREGGRVTSVTTSRSRKVSPYFGPAPACLRRAPPRRS
jgi:hypothetical protein